MYVCMYVLCIMYVCMYVCMYACVYYGSDTQYDKGSPLRSNYLWVRGLPEGRTVHYSRDRILRLNPVLDAIPRSWDGPFRVSRRDARYDIGVAFLDQHLFFMTGALAPKMYKTEKYAMFRFNCGYRLGPGHSVGHWGRVPE